MNSHDILNEKLCYNKYIFIDNKPITERLFITNNAEFLNHLLNSDMSFKTNQDLSWLTTMNYQLITSKPRQWERS